MSLQEFVQRKRDHIKLALDQRTQGLTDPGFGQIRLLHKALPEINFTEISLKTQLLDQVFLSPHFISSMTAGHDDSFNINLRLAKAAAEKQWLMAVGSQRRELTDPLAANEWTLIKAQIPDVKLVSNIGIIELIHQPMEKILKIIDSIGAVGVFIHMNPLQEAFQKEGMAEFAGGLKAIEEFVKKCPVPVLAKEVGFGIDSDLISKLLAVGVKVVDVAGHGGTHWAQIEAMRYNENELQNEASVAFNDWGYSTIDCLLACQEGILFNQIWASGGIRSGVDSAKCLALGARAVGIAQPLMKAAVVSEESVVQVMEKFDYELKVAMFCTGIKQIADFLHQKVWR